MKFDLTVDVREQSGKGAARQLRRAGRVPAVLYGQGECLLLSAHPDDLLKILRSHVAATALITLSVNGAKSRGTRTALLRDFQVDPVTSDLLHADLFEVTMDKAIRVKVPVRLIGGQPAGVKEGGVLHHNLRELSIECLPSVLPDFFEVDASSLMIGQGIHIKELSKKEGIRYLDDPDQMVVSVAAPMSEAKLEALLTSAAVGPEGAKEPEVLAKGKAAAEAAEAAAAAPAGAPAPAAAAEAKPGEKKEAAAPGKEAPKAEKKEAEKKK
jgi:large subunit ribosomal protein L25